MDTLVERMRQLHDAGWAEQFAVDDGGLRWTDAPESAAMVSHGLARIGQWLRENF